MPTGPEDKKPSAGTEVPATGRTQKPVLPQVRYHPTIQTQSPGNGARTKTTKTRASQTKTTRPVAVGPPQPGDQHGDNTTQVDLVPVVRPHSHRRQKQKQSTPRPNQEVVQKSPTDPHCHQQLEHTPRHEDIPLSPEVQLDKKVVKKVEVLTRGQRTNKYWFSWRKNRITASVAHRIAHCNFINGKSKTPPRSYLDAVTGEGPRFQTRAMSWGINMEAEVVRKYETLKSEALGHKVSVQDCGLFIDVERSWLAASPDGIVMDPQTGRRLLCLEVKCPYKHRDRRVEDACKEDRNFCLEIQEQRQEPGGCPSYRLKRSHSYFTQIQCQLAVTGLQDADLVVFTRKETAIVPVTFDPDLWEDTVSKLEVFYRDALLPHLRGKRQQEAAAAGIREL